MAALPADESSHEHIGTRDTNVPWYHPGGPTVPPACRELLEQYSRIPPPEVEAHVEAIRSKAWQIYPYPCIGTYRFLSLALSSHPFYPSLLTLLSAPSASVSSTPLLLDIGCCFGQDLRKLIHDGAPATSLIGADLRPEFVALGQELFRDGPGVADHPGKGMKLVTGNLFAPWEGGPFAELEGTLRVINASSFLHLWGWSEQLDAACQLVKLLKEEKGVMVLGRQVGSEVPGEKMHTTNAYAARMYKHDVGSFQRLWDEVGERVGGRWRVEGSSVEFDLRKRGARKEVSWGPEEAEWHDANTRTLIFMVVRED